MLNRSLPSLVKCVDVAIPSLPQPVKFTIGQRASDHHPMLDAAKPSDLWFHLDGGLASAHIIASVPDGASRTQIKAIIAHGARLSKELSKHGNRVSVMHTRVRNVSKTDVEGQVIVRPGS